MSESMLIYNYLERTKMERGGTARVAPRAFDRAKDMTHSQDETGQRYPYDSAAERGYYDEALDELWASRRDGEPHIPTFAKAMLERLSDVGFLHRTDAQTPVNVRTAKIGEEQEVWIRVDTHRDEVQGYMAVEVVDAPRSDEAILAAMIAWLAQSAEFSRFLEAQQFVLSGAYASEQKKIDESLGIERVNGRPVMGEPKLEAWDDFVSAWRSLKRLEATNKSLQPMQYVLPLLRYYKPDLDSRSPEEQQELIKKTLGHVNNFLDALRNLQAFLKYGTPNQRKLTPVVKDPKRDVQAAVMRDVDGLTYRQIGERMDVAPTNLEIKGENQRVRKMVERGRGILVKAFGEGGWRERIEKMKGEREAWLSLGEDEREKIIEEEGRAL